MLFTIEGFGCAVGLRYSAVDNPFTGGPMSGARSSGQRRERVYLSAVVDIEQRKRVAASIFEIAPTVLYAAKELIHDKMADEPITELFETELQETQSVRRQQLITLIEINGSAVNRDSEEIQKCLEDLRYI